MKKGRALSMFISCMRCRFVSIFIAAVTFLCLCLPSTASEYTDAMGRSVTIDSQPCRIVSLAPSLTEILYYLGLEEKVVGVTEFSYYPPRATRKPNVGTYVNLNIERIIGLEPDLAIGTADGNKRGEVELLEKAGIPIYIVNPRNIREVIRTLREVGELCGVGEKAHVLSDVLKEKVDYIHEKTRSLKRPLVFLQINIRPIITVNRNTFHHDVIRLAGGENMTADEPMTYPRIGVEEIVRRGPEVIIISSMERGGKFERARNNWLKWSSIPAVEQGRVHLIASELIDRPSPRIVKGLEKVARMIHPEISWNNEIGGKEEAWRRSPFCLKAKR